MSAIPVFEPVDDHLHDPSDNWYETETFWYSFWIPERAMGAWLYTGVRANVGVTTGGFYLWDASGSVPWDSRFHEQFAWLKAPRPDAGSSELSFANGMSITTIKPGMVYDLGFSDRKRVEVSLRFEALEAPVPLLPGAPPYPKASHYDQTGHVTGQVVLDGERIDVDCYAMRDRSWGTRTERGQIRVGYTWMASPDFSMLTYARAGAEVSTDEIYMGYVRRGTQVSRIVSGVRRTVRDPREGWVERATIEVTDEHGQQITATGTSWNRLILPGGTGVCINTGMTWTLDDATTLHGEDQDVWPLGELRRLRHGSDVQGEA